MLEEKNEEHFEKYVVRSQHSIRLLPVNGQRFNVRRSHPHCLPRNSLIMTSLQRASRTGKLEAKSGAFESSFAAGLDLSEFGLPSKRQESAAAELLRVKMEDSRQASQEEREERWIQEVAKAKGKELPSVVLEEYGSRRHAAPQASHIHGCVLLSVQTIGLVAILAE